VSTQTIDSPQVFAENERDIALAWLKYTIEHFQANIKRLRIGVTNELRDSFAGTLVEAAGGDELKLRIAYAIQGMYVDMGVGRGMGAGVTKGGGQTKEGRDYNELRNSRGQLRRHERRAKRWYGKQIAFDSRRLAELVSDLWGKTSIATIATAAPEQPLQVIF
jgi:hypothetical protein